MLVKGGPEVVVSRCQSYQYTGFIVVDTNTSMPIIVIIIAINNQVHNRQSRGRHCFHCCWHCFHCCWHCFHCCWHYFHCCWHYFHCCWHCFHCCWHYCSHYCLGCFHPGYYYWHLMTESGINMKIGNDVNNSSDINYKNYNSNGPRKNKIMGNDKNITKSEIIKTSLKPRSIFRSGPINTKPGLVQIMACRRTGDKSLSEPVMVELLTYASLGLNELKRESNWVSSLYVIALHAEVFCGI